MMKRSRRALALLAAAALALAVFTACGEKGTDKEIDIASVVSQAEEAAGLTDTLVALEDKTLPKSYPTLDMEKLAAYSCNVSGTFGTPEEISIFQAKSSGDVEAIEQAVRRRIEDQTTNFEDYRPEEMPKIEGAVVVTKGNYVLFAICPNGEAVQELFDSL